jgi:serine/threonine-protein kinase
MERLAEVVTAREQRQPVESGNAVSDLLAEHIQETLGGDIVLREVLGEGRNARVYLADQPGLGRRVAVKALMPRHTRERKAVARFKREARAMAGCPHPSIVSVYNVGETRTGMPFFVMEYVEGESLADRLLRKGRLPLPEAVRIAGALADALAYAHERGLVHRDLKPEDVLIDRYSGRILLTDFGLAKSVARDSKMMTLTGTGEILGTPAYLSPEQAECGTVDARSDQYSLAVVTYEMLAGRLPFLGPSAQDFVRQHAQDTPPSLLQVAPDLPLEVSRVIDRALMKEPGARFASADAFGQALRSAASAAMAPARAMAVRARRSRRWRIWQAAAIYAGGGWASLEALTWSVEHLSFPEYILLPAVWVVLVGFPVTMVSLWAIERSEEGRPLAAGR